MKIETFILIDECGDYVASHDQDQLKELYEAGVQELNGTFSIRIIKVQLEVPLPKPIIIEATIPDEECAATVLVTN